jgi:hypothetical protein
MPKQMTESNAQIKLSLSPTKEFFIGTLTRDITLDDAILDLVDNCIDGVLREVDLKKTDAYKGYWIHVAADPHRFEITDNCGGIDDPEKAFKIGKNARDLIAAMKSPQIGTYGIGMKRALFKLGTESTITWNTAKGTHKGAYCVQITPRWFNDEDDWDLVANSLPKLPKEKGTTIEVTRLRSDVSSRFAEATAFTEHFVAKVSQHYTAFIEKGLEIKVNGAAVPITPLTLRSLKISSNYEAGIAPYWFQGPYKGDQGEVEVEVLVGFYRVPPGIVDEDDELRTSADEAGITILCNDRVVVYRDKTALTGWGVSDVPAYHPQFSTIAGIMRFTAMKPRALPLTTTKRGIDASSEVFLFGRDKTREGLKKLTSFTNKLKKNTDTTRRLFAKTLDYNFAELRTMMRKAPTRSDRKWKGAKVFSPALPAQESKKIDTLQTIRFAKSRAEIETVADYLFEDSTVSRNVVGEECFDRLLKEAKK